MRYKKILYFFKYLDLNFNTIFTDREEDNQQKDDKSITQVESKTITSLDKAVTFLSGGTQSSQDINRIIHKPLFIGGIVFLIFFGVCGTWAAFAPLKGAVIAQGQVISSSNRKTIQHLEGGIIKEILVTEGEEVKKGQPLIKLSTIAAKAQLTILQEKLAFLEATEVRLLAQRSDIKEIRFPPNLLNSKDVQVQKVLANQRELFNSYKESFDGQIQILNKRIIELQNEVQGLEAQLKSAVEQDKVINEELTSKQQLLKDSHIIKSMVLDLKKQNAVIKGQIGGYTAQIAKTEQQITETQLQIINLRNNVKNKIIEELKENNSAIIDTQEKVHTMEDILNRDTITAPQDGVVNDLKFHTIGGVVPPASAILDIIPTNDDLIVKARISQRDIYAILTAQQRLQEQKHDAILPTRIKITAFSSRRVGMLHGSMNYISPDVLTDQRTGMMYYSAKIVIPKTELKKLHNLMLYPGMSAVVYITTQSRTLLDYLLTPITATIDSAFREK